MFCYTAYGLGIESEIRLSGPPEGSSSKDVHVRRGEVVFPAEAGQHATWATQSEVYCRIQNVCRFQISHGIEVLVDAPARVGDATLELFLLGPVLGILLQQRGLLVLHGSAVSCHGGVVAFLGNSGWGKSTMAGALAMRGYPVFTDDIVGVSVTDHMLTVPGFPRLKLKEETAEALGYSRTSMRPLAAGDDRREVIPGNGSVIAARPLECVYILAEGDVQQIENLGPQDAIAELIRHSYAASCLRGTPSVAAHLRRCAALVNTLPVFRLRRPRKLERIEEVATLVENNMAFQPVV